MSHGEQRLMNISETIRFRAKSLFSDPTFNQKMKETEPFSFKIRIRKVELLAFQSSLNFETQL